MLLILRQRADRRGPVAGTGYYTGAGTVNAWFNDVGFSSAIRRARPTGGPEIVINDEDGASPSEDVDNNWNAVSDGPRHDHQGPEVDAHRYAGNVVDYFRRPRPQQPRRRRRDLTDLCTSARTTAMVTGTARRSILATAPAWRRATTTSAATTGSRTSDPRFTQFTCGLVYNGESGALNESFSDVIAAFVTGDWLVFEDTWQNATAPAWRNMIDPTNGGLWDVADPLTSVLEGHQPSHYTVR